MDDTSGNFGREIANLLAVTDAFCAATRLSDARVSTLVFNDGSKLAALKGGAADITTRRHARALLWLAANWPDGAVWPAGVVRPVCGHGVGPLVHGENAANAAGCRVPSSPAPAQEARR